MTLILFDVARFTHCVFLCRHNKNHVSVSVCEISDNTDDCEIKKENGMNGVIDLPLHFPYIFYFLATGCCTGGAVHVVLVDQWCMSEYTAQQL